MENNVTQLTIREMTQQATSIRFWVGLLGIVCILTISAPFSTDTQLSGIQRFFYWGGIAISTYFCAAFVLLMVLRKLKQRGKPEAFARIIASLVAAVTISTLVFFINTAVVDLEEFHWKVFIFLAINCSLITLAISTLFFIVNDALAKVKTSEVDTVQTT